MHQILYLRHGESESNLANTFSGLKDDSSLTPLGEEQARQAGASLAALELTIDRIVSSPLRRAHETARIVAEAIGFDVEAIEVDPRLAEYDTGALTGTPKTDIASAQLIAAEGAEDPRAFMRRVGEAITELEGYRGTVLVVSHAGVGRVIRCFKENLDPAGFYDLPEYPNAEVIPL